MSYFSQEKKLKIFFEKFKLEKIPKLEIFLGVLKPDFTLRLSAIAS
jgi:hypothetical protein